MNWRAVALAVVLAVLRLRIADAAAAAAAVVVVAAAAAVVSAVVAAVVAATPTPMAGLDHRHRRTPISPQRRTWIGARKKPWSHQGK